MTYQVILREPMGSESIAPYWVEDIERVRADLDDIEKKSSVFVIQIILLVNALENIYKDRVSAVFDDKVKQCDAQIASYTQNLTRIFHKCETRLKNLQKRRKLLSFFFTYAKSTQMRRKSESSRMSRRVWRAVCRSCPCPTVRSKSNSSRSCAVSAYGLFVVCSCCRRRVRTTI